MRVRFARGTILDSFAYAQIFPMRVKPSPLGVSRSGMKAFSLLTPRLTVDWLVSRLPVARVRDNGTFVPKTHLRLRAIRSPRRKLLICSHLPCTIAIGR